MKQKLWLYGILTVSLLMVFQLFMPPRINAAEGPDCQGHGHQTVRLIPQHIQFANGRPYQAPPAVEEWVGYYQGQARIDSLDADLHICLQVKADGLFNLAYYFINDSSQTGLRYYVNSAGQLQSQEASYQDLTILSGGFVEADGRLRGGILG